MTRRAQATLEFSLVLIITIALIAGFYRIAAWLRGHIPSRQDTYDETRISAGQKASPGQPEIVYPNASLIAEDQVYMLKK
jgi:hypothetical protein